MYHFIISKGTTCDAAFFPYFWPLDTVIIIIIIIIIIVIVIVIVMVVKLQGVKILEKMLNWNY